MTDDYDSDGPDDDVLHPEREPTAALARIRAELGSHRFAAQYLQNAVPAEGNLVKAAWLKVYAEPADSANGHVIQSWDTANKTGPGNAYLCCITALVRRNDIYILDVLRKRMEFHELCSSAIGLTLEYSARDLLIEDMASGQQLIQELGRLAPAGVPVPIPEKPTSDKASRAEGISAMIEAGQLHLPREAPWLVDFKSELLGFPHTRFRDQVDALSQLMARVRSRQQVPIQVNAGPELMDEYWVQDPEADDGPWDVY